VEFVRRPSQHPQRLGILPGTFNPPTRAHVTLGEAALQFVDEVLFVMPRLLPHKSYEGVGLADRLEMVERVISACPRFSLASTEKGLFVDIARECREAYGPRTLLSLVCGRDAAERAVAWNYGRPAAFQEMLNEFELLVAARQGSFEVPPGMENRVRLLPVAGEYEVVSASLVRARILRGEPWEHLVPQAIVSHVRELYAN
jgi:nicotinate-nucleotide adenylyltransferase